jgi:hypothetical protein
MVVKIFSSQYGNTSATEREINNFMEKNLSRLFAAGDVHGSMGALAAAHYSGIAAISIVHEWFH